MVRSSLTYDLGLMMCVILKAVYGVMRLALIQMPSPFHWLPCPYGGAVLASTTLPFAPVQSSAATPMWPPPALIQTMMSPLRTWTSPRRTCEAVKTWQSVTLANARLEALRRRGCRTRPARSQSLTPDAQ
jgi:hypothetical protein